MAAATTRRGRLFHHHPSVFSDTLFPSPPISHLPPFCSPSLCHRCQQASPSQSHSHITLCCSCCHLSLSTLLLPLRLPPLPPSLSPSPAPVEFARCPLYSSYCPPTLSPSLPHLLSPSPSPLLPFLPCTSPAAAAISADITVFPAVALAADQLQSAHQPVPASNQPANQADTYPFNQSTIG